MKKWVPNHLMNRLPSRGQPVGRQPPPPEPIWFPQAVEVGCGSIDANQSGPGIVSTITTGYSKQSPEFTGAVLVASGEDGPLPEAPT
jgi:hypothetical protein